MKCPIIIHDVPWIVHLTGGGGYGILSASGGRRTGPAVPGRVAVEGNDYEEVHEMYSLRAAPFSTAEASDVLQMLDDDLAFPRHARAGVLGGWWWEGATGPAAPGERQCSGGLAMRPLPADPRPLALRGRDGEANCVRCRAQIAARQLGLFGHDAPTPTEDGSAEGQTYYTHCAGHMCSKCVTEWTLEGWRALGMEPRSMREARERLEAAQRAPAEHTESAVARVTVRRG